MAVPEFERLQIESVLGSASFSIRRGLGLHLMSVTDQSRVIFDVSVRPAMHKSGLDVRQMEVAFDSFTALGEVATWIRKAEVITADLSDWNADVAYVLGLCHALGRCPILLAKRPVDLPFNLEALRCVSYDASAQGFFELREELASVLRIFLTASRTGNDAPNE